MRITSVGAVDEFRLSRFLSDDPRDLSVADLTHLKEYLDAELEKNQIVCTRALLELRTIDVRQVERGEGGTEIRGDMRKVSDELQAARDKNAMVKSMLKTINGIEGDIIGADDLKKLPKEARKLKEDVLTAKMDTLSKQFRGYFLNEKDGEAGAPSSQRSGFGAELGKAVDGLKDAFVEVFHNQ